MIFFFSFRHKITLNHSSTLQKLWRTTVDSSNWYNWCRHNATQHIPPLGAGKVS